MRDLHMTDLFGSKTGSEEYLRIRNSKDNEGNSAYKKWLNSMWSVCEPYLPHDFLICFQKDAGKLDAFTWELVLCARFLKDGMEIRRPNSSDAPDIMIVHEGQELIFECALPTKGADGHPDAVPPLPVDGDFHKRDTDKSILRCTNAIQEKIKQHQRWLETGDCSHDSPFVIALHGRNIELSIHNTTLPDIVRAVYPVGPITITFNRENETSETGRAPQALVEKAEGAEVATIYFANGDNSQISGLLYSNDWGPFFHSTAPLYTYLPNPFAANPLPLEILPFSQICHSSVDEKGMIAVSLDPKELL